MKKYTPHLALFVANAIWAVAYPLYAYVMPGAISPIALFTATLIVSALLSYIPRLWQGAERLEHKDLGAIIGAALLIPFLRKGMLLVGVSISSPIDGAIIATLGPVMVLLLSSALGLDKLTPRRGFGLMVALAGAVMVTLAGAKGGGSTGGLWGNLMMVLCAMISAIYMVWFKSLLKKYSPATLMRWTFTVAAIAVIPFGFRTLFKVDLAAMTSSQLWAVAYLVVMPTYPPNLLLNFALKRVSPTVTSSYIYLQPLLAIAISVVMKLDKLSYTTALFAAMIFLGVGLVITSYNKSRQ